MTGVVPDRINHHTISRSQIHAPSPEMGVAGLVDKTVTPSDYREPEDSDDLPCTGNDSHLPAPRLSSFFVLRVSANRRRLGNIFRRL